jgi:hypothetical protein
MKSKEDLLLELMILVEQECPKYELVNKFFGPPLRRFLDLDLPDNGRAVYLFADGSPERLEARLQRIGDLPIVKSIFAEANLDRIRNATELDSRLMNLWAELRTIDQLHREGFTDICKHGPYYDFDATLGGEPYAVQVVRVNKEFTVPDPFDSCFSQIRQEVREGVSLPDDKRCPSIQAKLWETVLDKDSDFAQIADRLSRRRLIIVTSDSELDDRLLRYYISQCLAEFLDCPEIRYIDEISWLPNLGNGALLTRMPEGVKCFVDWNDRDSPLEEPMRCSWREANLQHLIPPQNW